VNQGSSSATSVDHFQKLAGIEKEKYASESEKAIVRQIGINPASAGPWGNAVNDFLGANWAVSGGLGDVKGQTPANI